MMWTMLIAWMTVLPGAAQEQTDMQGLLQAVLDQPAKLSLTDIKLADLIAVLEQETGVAVRMSPEVMSMLPHGPETLFTQAEFGNVPLREGLAGLFAELGMTLEVRRDHVEVVPTAGLLRIGRRATWEELDALRQVAALQPGLNDADVESLRARIQFRVAQREPWGALAARMREVGAGAGDEVLEIACGKLGWSWYPEGAKIVIVPRADQFARQLQRVVTVRSQRRPFTETLEQVSTQCGVPIIVDPGALSALSPDARQRFVFSSEGYAAGDVLNAIAAQARLSYLIGDEGVVFYDPASGAQRVPAAGNGARSTSSSDPVVGLVPVTIGPGAVIHLLVRESDLPPDVIEELKNRKAEVVETIRSSLKQP